VDKTVVDNPDKAAAAQAQSPAAEAPPAQAPEAEAPEAEHDELLGRTIGSYVVTRMLGKGGMGAVYAAEHPVIGSKVAIKFLHPHYSSDKKIVDRFFNEARAVNVIGHDNILKILDLNVTEDNRHYFIMEFLVGRPLQKLVDDGQPVPLEIAGPILLQFCEALQAAHDRKIYHRDIKPDNVYLIVHKGRKNFVKVVDFGIAKLTDESGGSTGKTQTGMVMGTPAYMSPEQAGGMGHKIDARSDIYSTGVLMFQLATGQLPFPGESFGEVLIGHLQKPAPAPRSLEPAIPEAYEAVILKALAKQQEARQQSMRELHDEIKAVMDQLGISAELPKATAEDLEAIESAKSTSPGLKLQTGAARARPSQPSARPSSTGSGLHTPQLQGTVVLGQQAPARPAASHTGLVAAIAVAVLVVLGGAIGFAMHQQQKAHDAEIAAARQREEQQREAAERERLAREAREKAQREAEEKAKAAKAPTKVMVVSDPLGASVQATWKGEGGVDNAMSGTTPFELVVPKDSKVHLEFKRAAFLDYATEVIADEAKSVPGKLTADPRAAPKKKRVAKAGESEDVIVDF
jgi:serine/threonine protein kinase